MTDIIRCDSNIFSDKEKRMLIELISNEQIHMILKDRNKYDSYKYKALEQLKVKIKDIWKRERCNRKISLIKRG